MSPSERADLARRLARLAPAPIASQTAAEHARRRFVVVVATASLLMIPWVAALAWTLPPRYLAGHWRATWVGFDLVLAAALALTAWAAVRRRQVVVLTAVLSAALLACDAWFDLMTAAGPDRWVSLGTALLIELPLAGWLFYTAHALVRLSMRHLLTLAGEPVTDVPLRRMPLFGVPPRRRRGP
ncbi:hypothetical protein OHA72_54780 [Dactylosporangium sp. NBC_01737]|uniref:hypothetical protein n=1 Tax=Dactylosporangium sp. NBC_01737 TaxID=2975959 RepID=UPI002E1120E0|nr:hypothetical protein OHA72_54780 [Dactylosporangium sp. NBC_01737]